jgi:hypothetical protein
MKINPARTGAYQKLAAGIAVKWGPSTCNYKPLKTPRKLHEKIDLYVCFFEAPGVFVIADRKYRPIARFRKAENSPPVFVEYVDQQQYIDYYAQLWLFNDGTDDARRKALRELLASLLPKIPPPHKPGIFVRYKG